MLDWNGILLMHYQNYMEILEQNEILGEKALAYAINIMSPICVNYIVQKARSRLIRLMLTERVMHNACLKAVYNIDAKKVL